MSAAFGLGDAQPRRRSAPHEARWDLVERRERFARAHPKIVIKPRREGGRLLFDVSAPNSAYNQNVATAQTLRTRDEFARFFAGLELVEPGLVQVHQWRPNPEDSAPEGTVSAHGGVAAKAG